MIFWPFMLVVTYWVLLTVFVCVCHRKWIGKAEAIDLGLQAGALLGAFTIAKIGLCETPDPSCQSLVDRLTWPLILGFMALAAHFVWSVRETMRDAWEARTERLAGNDQGGTMPRNAAPVAGLPEDKEPRGEEPPSPHNS